MSKALLSAGVVRGLAVAVPRFGSLPGADELRAAVLLCAAGSTEVCVWTFLRECVALYVPFFCECVSLHVPQCCCVRQEARRYVCVRFYVNVLLCMCHFYVNVFLCMCRSAAVCGRKHAGMFSDVFT